MTFQVTIMFGLGFMSLLAAILNLLGYFYYYKLIEIFLWIFWPPF